MKAVEAGQRELSPNDHGHDAPVSVDVYCAKVTGNGHRRLKDLCEEYRDEEELWPWDEKKPEGIMAKWLEDRTDGEVWSWPEGRSTTVAFESRRDRDRFVAEFGQ